MGPIFDDSVVISGDGTLISDRVIIVDFFLPLIDVIVETKDTHPVTTTNHNCSIRNTLEVPFMAVVRHRGLADIKTA